MKSIVVILLALCVASAQANDLTGWVPLWENDKLLFLAKHDLFFTYEYPDVIVPSRGINKVNNETQDFTLRILCDEWKVSLRSNGQEQTASMEITKGTVAAALFFKYCSELHRRTNK